MESEPTVWQNRLKRTPGWRKRLYICAIPQGISGFAKGYKPGIVTGTRVNRDLLLPWTGSLPMVSNALFRLEDGHLPEYQPKGDIKAVEKHLCKNPYSTAYFVSP